MGRCSAADGAPKALRVALQQNASLSPEPLDKYRALKVQVYLTATA